MRGLFVGANLVVLVRFGFSGFAGVVLTRLWFWVLIWMADLDCFGCFGVGCVVDFCLGVAIWVACFGCIVGFGWGGGCG